MPAVTGADVAHRMADIRKLVATSTVSHCRGLMLELEHELDALGDAALKPRNRHKTKQAVGTPWEFVHALEAEFGPLGWDLASTPELAKAPRFITPEIDSLTVPWHALAKISKVWSELGHVPSLTLRADLCALYGAKAVDLVMRSGPVEPGSLALHERFNYLNPEFKQSGRWVQKCAEEAALGAKLLVLLQASVDTEYYRDYILGLSEVRQMQGRLKFIGHKDQFPKALMTVVYEPGRAPAVLHWDWRKGVLRSC